MKRYQLFLILLFSLSTIGAKAQGDTVSVYLNNVWLHDTAHYNDQLSLDVQLQNTGDSGVSATNVIIMVRITTPGGANHIVHEDSTFYVSGGLFLPFPGDTATAILNWTIDSAAQKYMPGNNVTVIWPIASGGDLEVEDSLVLNTYLDEETGIYEVTVLNLKVYPNPTYDQLYIDHDGILETITISDLSGRVVLRPKSQNNVNVSSLSSGTYIISITDRSGRKSAGVFVKK